VVKYLNPLTVNWCCSPVSDENLQQNQKHSKKSIH